MYLYFMNVSVFVTTILTLFFVNTEIFLLYVRHRWIRDRITFICKNNVLSMDDFFLVCQNLYPSWNEKEKKELKLFLLTRGTLN